MKPSLVCSFRDSNNAFGGSSFSPVESGTSTCCILIFLRSSWACKTPLLCCVCYVCRYFIIIISLILRSSYFLTVRRLPNKRRMSNYIRLIQNDKLSRKLFPLFLSAQVGLFFTIRWLLRLVAELPDTLHLHVVQKPRSTERIALTEQEGHGTGSGSGEDHSTGSAGQPTEPETRKVMTEPRATPLVPPSSSPSRRTEGIQLHTETLFSVHTCLLDRSAGSRSAAGRKAGPGPPTASLAVSRPEPTR